MDIIFGDFKNWISSKKELWKEQGLIMDKIIESTHAHQIHINLHSRFEEYGNNLIPNFHVVHQGEK